MRPMQCKTPSNNWPHRYIKRKKWCRQCRFNILQRLRVHAKTMESVKTMEDVDNTVRNPIISRNWLRGRCGQGISNIIHYCCTHRMCAHPGKECRTPAGRHQKDAMWYKNMSGSKWNCTWQVGPIPSSKTNVEEIKTSNTSELLCRSTVNPPQHATIIAKTGIVASNNYWCTEHMSVLTNVKDTRDGPIYQFPTNETMSATRTGNTP